MLPGIDLSDGHVDGRTDTDPKGHGTRMAMLIAAHGESSEDMIGVAPAAKVMPIMFGVAGEFRDAGGFGSAKAVRWAVDHGAVVVNMSYAGPNAGVCPASLQEAILYALDHDVVLIAGAGNEGSGINQSESPALCPGVVAVGAIDDQGRPWRDTARRDYVDVAGPGVKIVSIDRAGVAGIANGTSDAAALVSGAVALLRARFPDMPARQIVTRLLATAKDAGAPGKDDQTGYGIVRPLNALTEDVPADAPNPVYDEVDRLRGVGASQGGPAGDGRARSERGGRNVPLIVGLAGGATALATLVVLLARRQRRSPTGAPPYPPEWGPSRGP